MVGNVGVDLIIEEPVLSALTICGMNINRTHMRLNIHFMNCVIDVIGIQVSVEVITTIH
jgi:hypothetical protein